MSSILVDNLTGKTTAGNVTVTSEGGAATLHMQQGLAKAWCTFNASTGTPTILDDFNVSSMDDDGVGIYGLNFTTNFWNNTSYATHVTCGQGGNKNGVYDNTATGSVDLQTEQATSGSNTDHDHVSTTHHGDLA